MRHGVVLSRLVLIDILFLIVKWVVIIKGYILTTLALLLCACGGGSTETDLQEPVISLEAVGKQLYSDPLLSAGRTMSCATCHDLERGLADPRLDLGAMNSQVAAAVSLAADEVTMGDRNSPSNSYSTAIPDFASNAERRRFSSRQPPYQGAIGGQFWDGRAKDLEQQAASPILSHLEMQMPSKAEVRDRIAANTEYRESFKALFGEMVFDTDDTVFDGVIRSIAAFERSAEFATFDSKYDKSLIDDFTFSPSSKAALGRALFFSQQFSNCATCHQLRPTSNRRETFGSYEYHNIGVPKNDDIRRRNGLGENHIDLGLAANPLLTEAQREESRGKFKSVSLRNVAVTAPYMHNGIFKDLTTVMHFYMHRRAGQDGNSTRPLNPETGVEWNEAEVSDTISWTELRDGRNLNDDEIEALVCFMHALTDERFEHLLEDRGCFD